MGDCFYCSKAEPVVQTKAGKIRGFKMNSTYTFHGIKYADAAVSYTHLTLPTKRIV